jgi:rhamnosyltransferase
MSAGSSADMSGEKLCGGWNIASVTCIIVSYRPDVAQLARLCQCVLIDGAKAIVVDNTEEPGPNSIELPDGCELVTLGKNTGIAHAQNVGVARALDAGAAALVFLDQDSKIEPGFLGSLVTPLQPGVPCITSPLYVDDDSNVALPSARLGRFGLPIAVYGTGTTDPYPVDIVISSGTAATKEVFAVAGVFDEALFIDGVDSEWCLRCRSKQIPIHVVPSAVMRHRIGGRPIRLGRLTVFQHSPIRCYYQIRNCFHMMRRKYIPFGFALRHMMSVLFGRIVLLFFVRNRIKYLRAYFAGLRDGVRGVAGAKPS